MTQYFDDEYQGKSRSQKKRESTAVQRIGQSLAALTKNDLQALDLPEDLLDAILDWKSYPGHEAKRRQMQYIGRIMRDMDLASIEEKLETHLAPNRAETRNLHEIETLRDRLINAEETSGNDLQTELADLALRFPAAPLPRLRHLAETARAERAGKKPPKAYRELFQILKKLASDEQMDE